RAGEQRSSSVAASGKERCPGSNCSAAHRRPMKVALATAVVAVGLSLVPRNIVAQHRIPLADVKSADSTIVVELRYAGPNNITGRPLYAEGSRALIRPELLPRLKAA